MQFTTIDFFMYLALISACILVVVKIVLAGSLFKKYGENRENKFLIPVAFLFLTFAIARITLIYFDFYLTKFDDDLFQTYSWVWKIAMTFQNIGFVFFIYVAEKEIFINKTKNIITIFSVIFLVLITFIPNIEMYQNFLTISLSIIPLFIPISYAYLVKKTAGTPRKRAASIVIGYFIYMFSMIMLMEFFQDGAVAIFGVNKFIIRYIMYSISMLIRIGGLFFIRYGYLKD